jgi:hypothetical protein
LVVVTFSFFFYVEVVWSDDGFIGVGIWCDAEELLVGVLFDFGEVEVGFY